MSLIGVLEELRLGEILQIVSLSRKTGVLSLSSRGRDGSVFFSQGLVVRATLSTNQQSLGEVLIQKEIIDLPMLHKALVLQQESGLNERLGVILVKNFGVSSAILDEVVREQIENVVFSLFAWDEGTFKFESQESIESVDGTNIDTLEFMLGQGLNPQFLAMEETRFLHERPHKTEAGYSGSNSSEDDHEFTFDLVNAQNSLSPCQQTVPHQIVVVDDDGPTLHTIANGLTQNGFIVHAVKQSEETLIKVDSLHKSGGRLTVLIDMIMPKMDGSGVLGGVELLQLLHKSFKDLQLIIMADYYHAESEKKIHELGYSFIIKPRRVEINTPEIMDRFLSRITHIVNLEDKLRV